MKNENCIDNGLESELRHRSVDNRGLKNVLVLVHIVQSRLSDRRDDDLPELEKRHGSLLFVHLATPEWLLPPLQSPRVLWKQRLLSSH